jgi:hypothetical protein
VEITLEKQNFEKLPFKAHAFLSGVPLHAFQTIALKGGREGMTIDEIYRTVGLGNAGDVELGRVTKALFDLRGWIGRLLGWDDVPELVDEVSYLPRLSDDDRRRSLIPPGKVEGISRVLYCFENEMMLEIVNRTVHCFWVLATEPEPGGYILYNVVYVRKLNWRTPIYMTLVSPMLKWIIYPAIRRSMVRRWEEAFPARIPTPTGKTYAATH